MMICGVGSIVKLISWNVCVCVIVVGNFGNNSPAFTPWDWWLSPDSCNYSMWMSDMKEEEEETYDGLSGGRFAGFSENRGDKWASKRL